MEENSEEIGLDSYLTDSTQDRLDNFVSALFELKYNIASVEKKHSFLGSELSAMCEQAISQLTLPAEGSELPVVMETATLSMPKMPAEPVLTLDNPPDTSMPTGQPDPLSSHTPSPAGNRKHPVAGSLDTAGDFIITGLDKMGDGIILIFEKLLALGSRNRKHPSLTQT